MPNRRSGSRIYVGYLWFDFEASAPPMSDPFLFPLRRGTGAQGGGGCGGEKECREVSRSRGLRRMMAVVVAGKDGKGKTGERKKQDVDFHSGAGRHGTTRQRSSLAYAWTTEEVYMG